ncbi:YceI family protein [Flavobacteriaceae bacterium F08102]|nr:YceI family protein [Flavobacteriaceae bacterium F08102]
MKKLFLSTCFTIISVAAFAQTKLTTNTGHIKFFSSTAVEDIEANNYKVVSNLSEDGTLVFSVPMQSFEFEKALMQKHYNSKKFLDTKKFPKAKFKGTISNISEINLKSDGTYTAQVVGDLTIHGVTNPVKEELKLTVKGSKVTATTEFYIVLADYGIAFKDGKPATNIAKEIKITANLDYK